MSQLVMFDFYLFVDDFSQKPLFDGDFPYILCHVHDVVAPTSPSQLPLSIEEFHRSARATVASVATQHQDATGEPMPWCPMVVSVSYGFSDVGMNERLDIVYVWFYVDLICWI